ncbi:hypothetical protein [Devosia sp. A449]
MFKISDEPLPLGASLVGLDLFCGGRSRAAFERQVALRYRFIYKTAFRWLGTIAMLRT